MTLLIEGGNRSRSKKWARRASRSIERKGTEGVFTKKTNTYNKKNGTNLSVMKFACHVRNHPEKYDNKTMDQANFALNINRKKCPIKRRSRSRRRRRSRSRSRSRSRRGGNAVSHIMPSLPVKPIRRSRRSRRSRSRRKHHSC